MLRYTNCRYCRRLLHGWKLPLRTALPKYQHSSTRCSYSLPSSSGNFDLQFREQKMVNWCECASRAKQNECRCLDCSATASDADTIRDELSEDIIWTLKSFFETFASYYNTGDVLHDLSTQTYEMLSACSATDVYVTVTPTNNEQMRDAILSVKASESIQKLQKVGSENVCTRSTGACITRPVTKRNVKNRGDFPDNSANRITELVNQCGNAQSASKLVTAMKGNFQLRTLKTSSCSTTLHDGASATALSCPEKVHKPSKEEDFKPLTTTGDNVAVPERKTKIASVEYLKSLTLQKDIIGLQKVLNEERWPSYHRLKPFISELFDVFIKNGEDVEEAILLIDSFASVNSRAVLPNSVIFQLLTRIVREKGVEAAVDYAYHYRNLFLVKPPLDGYFSPYAVAVAEDLFSEAFKRKDLSRIQNLCDTLIDLGFFRNSSIYLCAVVNAHLRSDGFETSFILWYQNARKYRVGAGSHLLIRHTLLEKNLTDSVRERRLRNILEKLEEFGVFYDGLAELVLEMMKAGMASEAELIMRRLKISGRHFRRPLFRLKNDEGSLPYIELFAKIFSTTLLEENRIRNTRKHSGHKSLPVEESAKDSEEPNIKSYVRSLLAVWQPRCKRKQKQKVEMKKKFVADAGQLQGLIYATQNVWFELATRAGDTESLKRLLAWITVYNNDGSTRLRKKLQDFFSDINIPVPCSDAFDDSH